MKALQSFEISDNTRPKRPRLIPKTCIFGNITLWETHVSHLLFWPITFLLHCVTSHKVAGSISDGVIGIFHWLNSSGRTTVSRSTLPLTEMSTRDILWRKGGRCVRLTLPTSCADCLEILEASTSWNPKGLSRPVWGDTFTFCLSRPYLIWTYFFILLYYRPALKLWFHNFPLPCIEILIPYCWWAIHYIFFKFRWYFFHDPREHYKSIEI